MTKVLVLIITMTSMMALAQRIEVNPATTNPTSQFTASPAAGDVFILQNAGLDAP